VCVCAYIYIYMHDLKHPVAVRRIVVFFLPAVGEPEQPSSGPWHAAPQASVPVLLY
jgi:hypothetical protein